MDNYIELKVKCILSSILDYNKLETSTKLADLNIDSLDIIEIQYKLEDSFNINIEDDFMNNIVDINGIIELVKSKQ
jgi:acyl carrier protein